MNRYHPCKKLIWIFLIKMYIPCNYIEKTEVSVMLFY